jgi:hypothetical protein
MEEVRPLTLSIRNILITVLDLALAAIVFFLGLRIVLELFSANPATPFVAWVYTVSEGLVTPFAGIFGNLFLGIGTLDVTAVIALFFYGLLFYLVRAIVDAVTGVTTPRPSYL